MEEGQHKYFSSILGDQGRYEQILLNFLSNSLKFTNQGGKVIVQLQVKTLKKIKEEAYNSFIIKVIDNGSGISEEGLKNLFVDF